jgi:hypothetical protein
MIALFRGMFWSQACFGFALFVLPLSLGPLGADQIAAFQAQVRL